jgi:hypothetical protein
MVLLCLDGLDLIALPLPNVFGVLLIAAAGTTITSGVWTLYTVERGSNQQRGRRLAAWGLVLPTMMFCGGSFVLPVCQLTVASAVRILAQNRLMQITTALHSYHGKQGHLPPSAILGPDGQPLLSWRVAILPYLDQDDLYQRFHLDESWDSPHNLSLLPEMPAVYWMPPDIRSPADMTFFQVLVGPGTAFERVGLRLPEDFPDGLATTVAVVEARNPVPWTQPADLVYDPNGALPYFGVQRRLGRSERFIVSMMDGSIHRIGSTPSETTLRAIITRNGGEKLPSDWNQ